MLLAACGGTEENHDPTYANVERILSRSCAFATSCHGGDGSGEAEMNFGLLLDEGRPLTEALVGVDACEYSFMPRVMPGDPEHSWIMIKLTSPHENNLITFTPDEGWDPGIERGSTGRYPPSECPLVDRNGEIVFGAPMPLSSTPRPLPEDEIELIRQWIAMGAPGPV